MGAVFSQLPSSPMTKNVWAILAVMNTLAGFVSGVTSSNNSILYSDLGRGLGPAPLPTPLTPVRREESHRYREQTSGYQWGEGRREGQFRSRGLRGTNYYI